MATVNTVNKKNASGTFTTGAAGETQSLTAVSFSGSGNARLGIVKLICYDTTLVDILPQRVVYDPAGVNKQLQCVLRWDSNPAATSGNRSKVAWYIIRGEDIGVSKTITATWNGSHDSGVNWLIESGVTIEGVAVNRSDAPHTQPATTDPVINVPANGVMLASAQDDDGAAITLDSGGTLITNHADWSDDSLSNVAWGFFAQGGTAGNNTMGFSGHDTSNAIAFYDDADDVASDGEFDDLTIIDKHAAVAGTSLTTTGVGYAPDETKSDRLLVATVMVVDGGLAGVTDLEWVSGVVVNPGGSEVAFVQEDEIAVADAGIWRGYVKEVDIPSAAGGPYELRVDFNGSVTRDDVFIFLDEMAGIDQTTPVGQKAAERAGATDSAPSTVLASVTAGSVVMCSGVWVDDRQGLSLTAEWAGLTVHDDDNVAAGSAHGCVYAGSTTQLDYGYHLEAAEPDPHIMVTEFLVIVGGPETPGSGTLTLTGFGPKLLFDQPIGAGALSLTGFAPVARIAVTKLPGTATLSLTGFAPTLGLTNNPVFQPGAAALVIVGQQVTIDTRNAVGAGSLDLAGFAPTVVITVSNPLFAPGFAVLTLTGFVPNVKRKGWKPVIESSDVWTPASESSDVWTPVTQSSDPWTEAV